MNEEEMNLIYTTYFESTKVESNDYIGCLGLGSKSPYSYTDTFTVESVQNGTKLTYICFIENGVPKIAKTSSEKTIDDNGMKVSFAVKKDDIESFRQAASNIYSYFQHKPKLLNSGGLKFQEREFHVERGEYKFARRRLNRYSDGKLHIIMGNIAYPVRRVDVQNKITNDLDWLFECGVEFDMPIGSVEIAANRETLHLDDRSIKNILKKLTYVKNDIILHLQKIINEKPNLWEAICYITEFDDFSIGSGFRSRVLNQLKYRGKDITQNIYISALDSGSVKKYPGLTTYQYKFRQFTSIGYWSKET
jgi:hypothetical protein